MVSDVGYREMRGGTCLRITVDQGRIRIFLYQGSGFGKDEAENPAEVQPCGPTRSGFQWGGKSFLPSPPRRGIQLQTHFVIKSNLFGEKKKKK